MRSKSVAPYFRDLRAEDESKREAAQRRLLETSPADKAWGPELAEYLKSKDARHRYWAARALANMAEEAIPALPALVKVLKDKEDTCRAFALLALGGIGEEAALALPQMLRCLRDRAFGVRQAAALVVVKVAPRARETEAALLAQLARDDDAMTREWLIKSLAKVRSKRALDAVIAALDDPDFRVRRTAVIQLQFFGASARGALDALSRLIAREANSAVVMQAKAATRLIENPRASRRPKSTSRPKGPRRK
jgi:HEAT repeat protein